MAPQRKRYPTRSKPAPRGPLAAEHVSPLPLDVDPAEMLPAVEVRSPVRHPILYRKRLGKFDPQARPGDLVRLQLEDASHFGYGLFNSRAEATVRVLNRTEELPTRAWWERILRQACELRQERFRLDEVANTYRVVHAEADLLPGIVIDRYDNILSAECFSLGMFRRAGEILEILQSLLGTEHWQIVTAPASLDTEGFDEPRQASPDCPDTTVVQEFGTRFRVNFLQGHKTGFFCDQRDNRKRLAEFCGGKSVLDLCCYTGGFSMQAGVLGNAADVTGVDLDEEAIAIAKANANLNQQKIRFTHADVFPYMRDMLRNEKRYEVVILDPPKLISRRDEFDEGRKKYFDLNRLACQLVKPGGLLLTCSCSGLMPPEEFSKTIAASIPSDRSGQFLYKWGAAGDHPVATHCPETEYLKAYLVQINER
ncbi:class I SAM-dependent rRNA methyltransferase [Rubinisphaera margarita]|uniref:class I SAM-dependent rRNA methyltransferase n=1 Tax=Rubinisphaera margarita TaxID=2909586 RepID=UPI001EE7BEEC|nr:class I SAM-dependent rRNA methyltransferase [Rubinisphaera margarita]MCG6156685.1 class I SAM-dependent rRNA methyltransferase [Rubinisphaera margarita]